MAEGTGKDVGNSSLNSSLNCEAGLVCEEGRRSEMKELPHLTLLYIMTYRRGPGWCGHHKTPDAPFIFPSLINFQGLLKAKLQV